MKHWTHNLIEGKRIFDYETNIISNSYLMVERLNNWQKAEIKRLSILEGELIQKVKKQYSEKEIKEAKREFEAYTNTKISKP